MPVPLAAVEQWLAELAPDAVLAITPVVDLTEQCTDPVDLLFGVHQAAENGLYTVPLATVRQVAAPA